MRGVARDEGWLRVATLSRSGWSRPDSAAFHKAAAQQAAVGKAAMRCWLESPPHDVDLASLRWRSTDIRIVSPRKEFCTAASMVHTPSAWVLLAAPSRAAPFACAAAASLGCFRLRPRENCAARPRAAAGSVRARRSEVRLMRPARPTGFSILLTPWSTSALEIFSVRRAPSKERFSQPCEDREPFETPAFKAQFET